MLPQKIVFLGDSITGYSDLEKYLKFSHIVDCMLACHLGAGKSMVVNKGIGGDTTAGVLKRLQKDVLDEKPDITVLLIGGNDQKDTPEKRAATRKNLQAIISSLKDTGSKVLVLQYHVLVNPKSPETAWVHLDDNNDLIAEVANEQDVPVLNMAPIMQQALQQYTVTQLVSGIDGVHLNPGGEIVFSQAIYGKLVELGWVK